jgi:hypothetical protein
MNSACIRTLLAIRETGVATADAHMMEYVTIRRYIVRSDGRVYLTEAAEKMLKLVGH